MIIKLLLELIYSIFALLTLPINLPSLPSSLIDLLYEILGLLGVGLQIVGFYFDLDYILMLFGIIVSIDIGLSLYNTVMYLIKKIPFFGIN